MSSATMKESTDLAPFTSKHANKLNSNVKNEIDKDIAVENVIRQLRQKKNIEVKKVSDVDSKLKRISPIVEKTVKSEVKDFDASKPPRINSFQNASRDRNAQSGKPKNFLEIEDDEIEDYLEIDQNVVEDLEALIPEEEIVSISNSLIQPEEKLPIEVDETTEVETKPNNVDIPKEPISICDSGEIKDLIQQSEPQDLELKVKNDDEVENKSEIQQNDDLVIIESSKEDEIEKKNEVVAINNNDFETETNNKIVSTSTVNLETTKRKSPKTLENPKKQKTSHNTTNTEEKGDKIQNNKKSKPKLSGNSRKITDFFVPDTVKNEINSVQQTEEIKETLVNSQPEPNLTIQNCPSEVIHLEEDATPIRTRTLRSSSKLAQVSKTKESQSTHKKGNEEEITTLAVKNEKTNNPEIIDVEVPQDSSVLQKTEPCIKIDDELCEEVTNKEITRIDSNNTNKSKPTKSKRKKKSKKANKRNNSKIVQTQGERFNNIPEDEEGKEIEEVVPINSATKVEIQEEETNSETKDNNENHLIIASSDTVNEMETSENQPSKKKRGNKLQKKKVQKLLINETSDTTGESARLEISSSKTSEPEKSASDDGEMGSKKRKRKISSVKEKISYMDHSEDKSIKKNDATKLEIYDFDDQSNEEIETLKKPVKNRKQVFSDKRLGPNQLSPINTSENINNNRINALPNSIGSSMPSEESQEDLKPDNKDGINLDLAVSTPGVNLPKANPGNREVTEEFGANWKPSYGPYKRVDRCNVCLLAFKSYKKLRAHKKVHEVENPYKCNKCGDSFEDVEKLAAHLRIHKGFVGDMDLIELASEIDEYDDEDVKPIASLLQGDKKKSFLKRKKITDSCEDSSESNGSTPRKILEKPDKETKSSRKRNKEKEIQIKITEVKRNLTKAIKNEANAKPNRVKRKYTRSIKTECKKEYSDESDDCILESFNIPIEDQDEYSQIASEDSQKFQLMEAENEVGNECLEDNQENSTLADFGEGIEDQDEYTQKESVNSEIYSLTDENEAVDDYPQDSLAREEESILIEGEDEIEDQDEYSQISHDDSERLTECDYNEMNGGKEQLDTDASLGMMNEMAEAEYMLEKDTKASPQPKKRRKRRGKLKTSAKVQKEDEAKIIKVKRDNLPPLILKTFRKKTLLLGKMPFACKKCDATFWTSFQLDKHQLVHVLKKAPPPSKPPSKVFKCEECGKEFKKICDLERHTRVHTGEKPSVCNICNKRFQQPYNLNKHLYTHTQEKNFECVICQKKFGRNDVLNRHVLTHSIVKPFRCSVCSRTFIRNSQLKLHFKKHHGLEKDEESETSNTDAVASTSAE